MIKLYKFIIDNDFDIDEEKLSRLLQESISLKEGSIVGSTDVKDVTHIFKELLKGD